MKLTSDNYFSTEAQREYMSVSQYNAFSKCLAAAMAETEGKYEPEKTAALLVGSYVDAYFEGKDSFDAFCQDNPCIFKKDGTLKSEYIQADEIIKRIESDKLMTEYLGGEKQVIMTGSISGVDVKIKVDNLLPDKIVDLKVMRDFCDVYQRDTAEWRSWFKAWRYDLQGAVYQEIVRQNTGKTLPFYLVAATKEKVADIDIVHIVQESLDYELEQFRENVVLYDAIKKGIVEPERCGRCDYCKATKVLTKPTESNEIFF